MDKKKEIKYNAWNEYLINTREKTNYAIRRFDLLLITLSGAGIYIIFETIREFKTGKVLIDDSILLSLSGAALLLSIICNFTSQFTGYKANHNEEKYIIIQLCKIEGKNYDKSDRKEYNRKSKLYTKRTNKLNFISMILMFIGLGLLAYFNYRFF